MKNRGRYVCIIIVLIILAVIGLKFVHQEEKVVNYDLKLTESMKLMEGIKLEYVNRTVLKSGATYSLNLKNNTDHLLVKNHVYMSFPIKKGTIRKSNFFMIEGRPSKANIESGESINLTFYMDFANYNENIDLNDPQIRLSCYFDKLADMVGFTQGGDLEGIVENGEIVRNLEVIIIEE